MQEIKKARTVIKPNMNARSRKQTQGLSLPGKNDKMIK